MSTRTPETNQELQQAMRRLLAGIRDPAAMKRSMDRMDQIREEIRQKHGVVDIGVPAIREIRDE